mmetsp:Transcript_26761/g.64689  ORF Transcript_26761/g.64689 Transcript_26761/m.64689 type:complete len:579 (+) Transcript_26761:133-1869(+)
MPPHFLYTALLAATSVPGVAWPAPAAAIALGRLLGGEDDLQSHSLLQLVFCAFALRFFLVLATAMHEASHIVAAFVLSRRCPDDESPKFRAGVCTATSADYLLFNVPLALWAQCLCPLCPWPRAAQPCVHLPSGGTSPCQDRAVRLSGALFSLLLALVATFASPFLGPTYYPVCLASAWMVASGAAATDVLGLGGESAGTYKCGNFGMLVVALLDGSVDVPGILRSMAATTAARGGQSGGIVTVMPDGSAVRERHVPTKRSDIAEGLVSGFVSKMRTKAASLLFKAHAKPSCSFFLGHTRFATSSAPTIRESHPHRFSNPQRVTIWRRNADGWQQRQEDHEVYVTHNGDLDYWPLFGVQRTQKELGAWLRCVLHCKNAVAGCDSVKVAGVVELLRTQGVWRFSMRLAFQQVASPSFDATLMGSGEHVMGESVLKEAAKVADSVFASYVSEGGDLTGPSDLGSLSVRLTEAFSTSCPSLTSLFPQHGSFTLGEFARRSISNFVQNDLFSALSTFLSDAQGSFGISTCCTLDRDVVCIASRGQAMSISFNPHAGTLLWGSEAAAQNIDVERKGGGGGDRQ